LALNCATTDSSSRSHCASSGRSSNTSDGERQTDRRGFVDGAPGVPSSADADDTLLPSPVTIAGSSTVKSLTLTKSPASDAA
jgi:hypothetical protein